MLVQKEISNPQLARALKNIDEKELFLALKPFIKKDKPQLLKVGKHRPFRKFRAIKMKGDGPKASEILIKDRM
ncbi:MAG: hypothetical protein GWN01_11235 [Nitrosopumilaceae archaeon]|nr:hypothetical protein [Nitrosopumilaceae archaeon]NIX62059.1 hypothetical protein [Nitrosopumilaceae archaeon]